MIKGETERKGKTITYHKPLSPKQSKPEIPSMKSALSSGITILLKP
jgi:hypothetical protein